MYQHESVAKFLVEDKQRELRKRVRRHPRPPSSERRWVRPAKR
jgi:hypothetical protein